MKAFVLSLFAVLFVAVAFNVPASAVQTRTIIVGVGEILVTPTNVFSTLKFGGKGIGNIDVEILDANGIQFVAKGKTNALTGSVKLVVPDNGDIEQIFTINVNQPQIQLTKYNGASITVDTRAPMTVVPIGLTRRTQ